MRREAPHGHTLNLFKQKVHATADNVRFKRQSVGHRPELSDGSDSSLGMSEADICMSSDVGGKEAAVPMHICDLFRALRPPTYCVDHEPSHRRPPARSPLDDTSEPQTPFDPVSEIECPALAFALRWWTRRTQMDIYDVLNYAERAVWGCRWGAWTVRRHCSELVSGKWNFGDIEAGTRRWQEDQTLPSVQPIVERMTEWDRQGVTGELLAALWERYPTECLSAGLSAPTPCLISVVLRDLGEGPIVRGAPKAPMSRKRYAVIKALLDAHPHGLSEDELKKRSGLTDARKIMYALRDSDEDWKAVLLLPGNTGAGYRIA